MVTEQTNTVWNCATCHEAKARHHRTHEWMHLRGDSLCDDAGEPVPFRLPVPARNAPPPAVAAMLDYLYT